MVGIGVIGCGKIAERHLSAYKKLGDVDITIGDRQSALPRRPAYEAGVAWAESPAAILSNAAVTAIDVWVPTRHHCSVVLGALRHGKHVFCEKPLCFDLGEAREIKKAALEADRLVVVGYLYRFH